VVLAAIVEVEAGVRPKRTRAKVVVNFVKSRITPTISGCYSGQGLVCAIPMAHIAFSSMNP